MTPEDLNPSSLFEANAQIGGLLAFGGTTTWPWGQPARAFVDAATQDAADQASSFFGCFATNTSTLDLDTILSAAERAGASEIITVEPPIGPIADALAKLVPALNARGVSLVRRRRGWDERFWPYATKGFFSLRERIGDVLAEEGLPS